jgi:hypothetical protein
MPTNKKNLISGGTGGPISFDPMKMPKEMSFEGDVQSPSQTPIVPSVKTKKLLADAEIQQIIETIDCCSKTIIDTIDLRPFTLHISSTGKKAKWDLEVEQSVFCNENHTGY